MESEPDFSVLFEKRLEIKEKFQMKVRSNIKTQNEQKELRI